MGWQPRMRMCECANTSMLAFMCSGVVRGVCLTKQIILWMCVHAFVRALACFIECVRIFVYVNVYVSFLIPQTNQITTISKCCSYLIYNIKM